MFLSDIEIEDMCKGENPLISPYTPELVSRVGDNKIVSYGPSSYGYDLRLGEEFCYYVNDAWQMLDPMNPSSYETKRFTTNSLLLRPGQFILAETVEYVRLPRNVTGLVCDKSTYARCGVTVQNTVIEAGFEGTITLEITNHNNCEVLLRTGQGIVQLLLAKSDVDCRTSYADRGGKYQGQTGVTLPR